MTVRSVTKVLVDALEAHLKKEGKTLLVVAYENPEGYLSMHWGKEPPAGDMDCWLEAIRRGPPEEPK